MQFQNLTDLAQATLDLSQGTLLPILGVCLAVALLFLILQIVFSVQDHSFQFLVRLVLLGLVCAFLAKSVSEKFLTFTKNVFESAPEMVR